ncbi:glycosyltransferase family 2 protein [Pseudonocardia artemisiae]
MTSRPTIAVVIPTLGASATKLLRLLTSIQKQSFPPHEVVVVSQGPVLLPDSLLTAYGFENARVIRSETGLSRARNRGLEALQCDWDIVALPDDDVWYSDNAFEKAWGLLERTGAEALSGSLYLPGRIPSRHQFPNQTIDLDASNVWSGSIEAAYFFRRRFIHGVGGYDESLGLGSRTPWQSGEGTDLLLRGIKKGYRVLGAPDIEVWEDPQPVSGGLIGFERHRKYGRGTGRVYRLRYSVPARILFTLRSIGAVVTARSRPRLLAKSAALLGRIEGMMGICLKR